MFDLFEVNFLFKSFSLSSKSFLFFSFFTKLAVLPLLAKFACTNLAAKFIGVRLLKSGVVIYLS